MRVARLVGLVLALVLAAGDVGASERELAGLFARILNEPFNVALQLRYATLAEELGQTRKALASYERVLLHDPGNQEAARGLQRVRRMLRPATTRFTLETGIDWMSNPRRRAAGADDDVRGRAALTVRDERAPGGVPWRTIFRGIGHFHLDNSDLDHARVRITTGPVLDVAPRLAVHPLVGAGAAMLDHRAYYAEALAGLAIEGRLGGALQLVRITGGYRHFDPSFTSEDGFFADIVGRFVIPGVIAESDAIVLTPHARWSGIDGTAPDGLGGEIRPGRYVEAGARAGYHWQIDRRLTLGSEIFVRQTWHETTVAGGGAKRSDLLLAPGAFVIFNSLFAEQSDLRLDYRYEWNESNDPARDYDNHVVSATLINRF